MNHLKNKVALVTGGSKGIGRGIVEALAVEGATIWALARGADALDALKRDVQGVQTISADVTDPQTAAQSISKVRPDILVLNAGALLTVALIQEQSWEQYNQSWDTDVKATFLFGKEALIAPLAPGSTVVIVSSGAAFGGAPLSGGYAAAKRAQWIMAQHLQQEANKQQLGIRFMVLVPKQVIVTTDLGRNAAARYAILEGVTQEQYLARTGSIPLTVEMVGQGIVSLLTEEAYQEGLAFAIDSQGLSALK